MSEGDLHALIVKLAALCNLNCSYCYVYNGEDDGYRARPRFISDEVFDALLERTAAYCARRAPHTMRFAFHGGEPTLIGPDRFAQLAARARSRLGPVLRGLSIQTNATLIDERWTRVLIDNHVTVGVSLDGPAEIHDAARVDHLARGSHARTLHGIERLRAAGVEPTILCVINPGVSSLDVYRYFRSIGVARMNFLLPDVSHDNRARLYGRHGPTPVADYLIPVFDAWFAEDDPKVFVRIFDSLLSKLLGGGHNSDAFGNPLMSYLVVETDGSIEALDALRVCENGISKSGLTVLTHGFDDLASGLPLVHRAVHEGIALSAQCGACSDIAVCGGGYLPHRFARANGFDNPSVWCRDILVLLAHIRSRIGVPAAA
ncbi:MAG TPA: radical SAM protein [Candidatus Elarobacter sp.]|nr:radical SAM protein [Dongiaceae bacterium]HZW54631.1 radical SAM protein [Candidatus Elarobacter sp.]